MQGSLDRNSVLENGNENHIFIIKDMLDGLDVSKFAVRLD